MNYKDPRALPRPKDLKGPEESFPATLTLVTPDLNMG